MIQGDDSEHLTLADLRGRCGVVPQSPVLFTGTLRDNLDPAAAASDEELAAALQVGTVVSSLGSINLMADINVL